MKIVIICEGKTEKAFKPKLLDFLETRLGKKKPKLQFDVHNGPIPKGDDLKKVVENHLSAKSDPADAVIGLPDVYPEYKNAADAKDQMRKAVGPNPKFHAHCALHDFEAWLLVYWDKITRLAGRPAKSPGSPEKVNHGKPPGRVLQELFRVGKCRDSYNKPRDANRILKGEDLITAINACPELKAFVNTILKLCGSTAIP